MACACLKSSLISTAFEDTLKAGHYENDKESVGIMINSSPEVVKDLVSYGADFARNYDGSLAYTREGAHSHNRIIFHEDVTGKEITSTLLAQVKKLSNVTLWSIRRWLISSKGTTNATAPSSENRMARWKR